MTPRPSILPMSTLLPVEVRNRLVAAANFESRIDPGESEVRTAILDGELADIRKEYPQYFQ